MIKTLPPDIRLVDDQFTCKKKHIITATQLSYCKWIMYEIEIQQSLMNEIK